MQTPWRIAARAAKSAVAVARRAQSSSSSSSSSSSFRPLSHLTEDEEMMRDTVRRLADEEIRPLVRKMESDKRIDQGLLKKLHESGVMGMEIPAEYGGTGANFTSTMIAVEELAKVDASIAVLVDIQNTLINAIVRNVGSEEQKREYLPRLAGQYAGSFCLSEVVSGSDAFALKSSAKRDGEHYVLNGSKMWISNSDIAGLFVVFVNADPSAGYRGITAFLVERDTPGLKIARPESKLGLEASGTCAVHLEDVRVPASAVLGKVGQGYRYAASLLNESRIGIGAQQLGIAQGCLDATVPYTLERKQFGQEIFSFQALQHQLAQMAMEVECARLLVYNAARKLEHGEDVMREAAMAKLYASEMAQRVTSKCIDLMGGVGFTKDYPQEKYFRDCKAGTIYEGTSNMQLTTIAKSIRQQYS
ncbi:short/branched chain specific acyl-CoA dehydrogenase, mitochondrial [Nasonia vitripennis]|uniref:Short/branched chain specific acyl-CoA dehydrogenase, mitochondrial n=1 Tax=Nasonia vitripennis TaxID=7425 RepID=A0A7M7H8I1_NASVI|nr:short/branched chain specific acyl-CoA dehydrogenase, mitochondrial [Nasonia vitripennis]